ncbi:MAG: tRNA pseudouridine(38-40) synthase TruA [Candidatus Omnitrophota bacterium]|nr:tRNA pseudouridine(38-40) synthase TruA [Candidatus Omnitrophota bacterium]
MRNIKLTLEYDGASFYGFQKQPHHISIQESLEKALSKLLNRKTKIAAASGRTDTGVHAHGQVVNFKTQSLRELAEMQRALNGILPAEIAVTAVDEVAPDFHARYSAVSKIYEYSIWNEPVRSPLRKYRSYHVPQPLNLVAMRRAARLLVGRHDFRSFGNARGKGSEPKSTVRTLKRLEIRRVGELVRLRFEADGFLYQMVRNLVGALVAVGRGKLNPGDIRALLRSKDRRKAPAGSPAEGLALVKVKY